MIRFAIIGPGNVGLAHAAYLHNAAIPGASLTAIAGTNPQKLAALASQFPGVRTFTSHHDLLAAQICDAILIATPHYHHVPIALDAFAAGHHVLLEKPLAVSLSQGQRLITTHQQKYSHLLFGIMFNQRTRPLYQTIRNLINDGRLGALSHITWIITDWFRSNTYYNSNPWRGEGGGLLLNQAMHNLDLLLWLTGLTPQRITATATLGKTHPIEVEDEVSAIIEFAPAVIAQSRIENQKSKIPHPTPAATAHFIASTGEYPGLNRLEIVGTRGRLIAENNTLTLTTSPHDSLDLIQTAPDPMPTPPTTTTTLPIPAAPPPPADLQALTANFITTLLAGGATSDLLAPAPAAIPPLELANATLLSALTHRPIDLPLDLQAYDALLHRLSSARTT